MEHSIVEEVLLQLERAQHTSESCSLGTLDCIRLLEPLLPDMEVNQYSRLVQRTVLSYYRTHHEAVDNLVLADLVSAVLWRMGGQRQDYGDIDERDVINTVRSLLGGLSDIVDAEATIRELVANDIGWRLTNPDKADEQLQTLVYLGLVSV